MKTKLAILLLGVVLTMGHAQTHYQRIKSFDSQEFSTGSDSTLVAGREGKLYGTMNYAATAPASGEGAGAIFSLNQDGGDFRILRAFQAEQAYDGSFPNRVIEGSDGALYGTTSGGGTNNNSGTAFKLSKDGSNYQVLRRFTGPNGDGSGPRDLLEGTDGWLYGVTATAYGNAANRGTLFKLRKDGSGFIVLRSFGGGREDGDDPVSLIEARDGALFGTTYSGGAADSGTVFKLSKDGSSYSVLFKFSEGHPQTRLVEGSDGALYGTTATRPSCFRDRCSPVRGIVFKLNQDGTGYTVVYRFPDSAKGAAGALPRNLVEGIDGALYGTTGYGQPAGYGMASGAPLLSPGVLFKLNREGSGYAVLHQFASASGDGNAPESLALGSDGALYGTTISGGEKGLGTVFKLFSTPPVVRISGIEVNAAGVRLNVAGGGAGEAHQLQATTNLTAANGWQLIDSSTAGIASIDGTFQFLHSIATNEPTRFYRVVAP